MAVIHPKQPRAEKSKSFENELLEGESHGGTTMDNGAEAAPKRGHKKAEALEPVHRTNKRKG